MKGYLTKIFVDEINSKPPQKNYPPNKIKYNLIGELWSRAIEDMIDYKTWITEGFRYITIIIEIFLKIVWCIPLKKKNS